MTQVLVDLFGGIEDMDLEATGLQFSEDVEGTNVVRIEWGQVGRVEPGDWMPYTTSDSDMVRLFQSQLHANHRRTIAALHLFVGVPYDMPIDGGFVGSDPRVGTWDGETLLLDGQTSPFPVVALLPPPSLVPVGLDADARLESWANVDEWVDVIEPIVHGGIDALPGLRGMDLVDVRATLCALLDTEWEIAHAEASKYRMIEMPDHGDIFFRELTVHDLLLLTEYLGVIQRFMNDEDVDWMNADPFDATIAQDGITTGAEFLAFIQSGAADATWRYQTLATLAPLT